MTKIKKKSKIYDYNNFIENKINNEYQFKIHKIFLKKLKKKKETMG